MFEIKKLHVSANGKKLISGLDISIRPGEIHVLMGPNGAGKSSLAEAIMGHPSLVTEGSIRLDSKELLGLSADQRAKAGLFLAFQHPEELEGVKITNLIRRIQFPDKADLEKMVESYERLAEASARIGLEKSFLSRDMNVGFSGGEKKRMEILQMLALRPKAIILDEVDSGLDIDGISVVARAISELNDGKRCFLIITHYPRILKYIKPDKVHILAKGRIIKSGDMRLAEEIEEKGYGFLGEKPDV